jgi:transcriptional regulator with XRE-family HTH domain
LQSSSAKAGATFDAVWTGRRASLTLSLMPTWNAQLRAARESRGISRQALADLSGQSFESLRSYELGRRRPTREHLTHLLKCLKLDRTSRNLILAGAGFAPDAPVERFPEPNVPTQEAVRLIRERPLPAVLVNARAEVLAVSGAAWRLLGMRDYELDTPRRRNVLSAIVFHEAAARLVNWDEVIGQTIQFFKAASLENPSVDAAGPPVDVILEKLTAGDPALMTRFVELWETTPPFQGRMTGHTYPSVWNSPGGTIRFNCFVGCLNTEMGLYAHTWVPADAKSHLRLEKLLADPAKTIPRRSGNR